MKIIVLSSHTPSLFWFRKDMMLAFKEKGYDVVAVGNEDESSWKDRFFEFGITYRQIYVQRNGTNPFDDLKTLRSIKSLLKKEKPDKIFCYQAKTVIYGCIAAHRLKIAEVYPLIAGIGSVFLTSGVKSAILKKILITEYKWAIKYAKRVFFQNHDDSDVFIHNGILKAEKITYINGSGVNVNQFTVMELPSVPSFLNISRLIRDKGIREYLEACRIVKKEHPEYRCMLVGPFDSNPTAITKEELDAFISDGTIEYFGEQSDVRPYIAQASIFVLPSYHEGTPKTVLEAMACGRAVITTNAPGCKETVVNNENGILIEPRNHLALANAMLEMASKPDAIQQMGVKGRLLAETKYAVNIVNEVILTAMNIN